MAACILAVKGTDSILCYPGRPASGVIATTGLNPPRKFMNVNGCRISFHSSSESQRLINGSSDRY